MIRFVQMEDGRRILQYMDPLVGNWITPYCLQWEELSASEKAQMLRDAPPLPPSKSR